VTSTEISAETTPRRRITRRAFLRRLCGGGAGTVALAGLGAGYAHYVEPFWPTVECLPLDLPRLHPALVGLRLVQLSDLHLSPHMRHDYLRAQLRRCQELSPDLIVLTGDFITDADPRFLGELQELLDILHAPLGCFAVLGNHDCSVHSVDCTHSDPILAARIEQALTGSGVTVLRNRRQVVEHDDARLQLVGLDDLWSRWFDADKAFADVDPNLPCITLAHTPDSYYLLRDKPWHWLLCGHTHGGQVRIPFLGAPYLPVHSRKYDAGLFRVGDQRLYVNRGLGYLHQFRFNCRPEITVFTLTSRV
jgi:uncharacterized protein